LGNIFEYLGGLGQSIYDGSDALTYIGSILQQIGDIGGGITAGSNSLYYASTIFGSFGDVDAVSYLGNIFEYLGSISQIIYDGADALTYMAGSLSDIGNISQSMLLGVDALGYASSIFDNADNAWSTVDGFVGIFQLFADNQGIIMSGVDAINSINRLDLTGLSLLNDLNSAIYGNGTGSLSIASTPITTTSTVIDDATAIYYAKTTQQFEKMIELLTIANKHAENLVNVNEDGHDDVVNAINSSSGTIY
jgi:hypothetical protein